MSTQIQALYLIGLSVAAFWAIPQLPMIIKNYKLSTPSPTNKLGIFSIIINTLIVLGPLLHPQLIQIKDLYTFILINYLIAFLFPFIIPSYSLEFLRYGKMRSMHHTNRLTVKFKPEYKFYYKLWHGRYLIILIVLIIFIATKFLT
ncbi:MAG TPA: hypothetical protein DCS29_00400 [Candidatus Magasanikbacteria bacterium]|nr:MAG: hypothetical protein A2479_03625 [Candidatus Magasanikbacteria bacterium RIFOXYC2_FULL_39_8]HAT03225.1 hypothetical protein [Candidatus Magasanikbacteria bacterium]